MTPLHQKYSSQALSRAVKDEAKRLGFQLVGITTPDPPPHLEEYLNWLAHGHHAGMSWMATDRARERRSDPCKILPGCKSILVLGFSYPAPPPMDMASTEQSPGGPIAAYARGKDYHDVLPGKLKAIAAYIQKVTGTQVSHRWYTDTGPILEREMAQRAGLGWIGKNTCLINPIIGSYTILAEILLGVELEPDEPFSADHCGNCTRCLEACPTGSILPNRTIDAGRCISYLTIEHKGSIPGDLRSKLEDWVFGCDICQQVCPWNREITKDLTTVADSAPDDDWYSAKPGIPPESLIDELALTPQEFNAKFKGSPIKRTKRRGYLRNIITILGNKRKPDAVPRLIQSLEDPEPLIRSHAAWALGEIGGEDGLMALKNAGRVEQEPEVLAEIRSALDRNQTQSG